MTAEKLLAVIDERPFKADLDSKVADQQKAESTLAIVRITHDRDVMLKKRTPSPIRKYDNAKAACDQAAAAVASAKAAVETSRLNLEWCRVLSPIDGRVSDRLVTVGNFINGGGGAGHAADHRHFGHADVSAMSMSTNIPS